MGQSRKDNIKTRTTLGTRHRTKTKKTKTQHRKLKRLLAKRTSQKTGLNPGAQRHSPCQVW